MRPRTREICAQLRSRSRLRPRRRRQQHCWDERRRRENAAATHTARAPIAGYVRNRTGRAETASADRLASLLRKCPSMGDSARARSEFDDLRRAHASARVPRLPWRSGLIPVWALHAVRPSPGKPGWVRARYTFCARSSFSSDSFLFFPAATAAAAPFISCCAQPFAFSRLSKLSIRWLGRAPPIPARGVKRSNPTQW